MSNPPNLSHPCNRTSLLDALTGAPPTDADERFFHNDLRYMSAAALWHELSSSTCTYLWISTRTRWRERYRRIREEMQLRER